jgi:hypothetical protein
MNDLHLVDELGSELILKAADEFSTYTRFDACLFLKSREGFWEINVHPISRHHKRGRSVGVELSEWLANPGEEKFLWGDMLLSWISNIHPHLLLGKKQDTTVLLYWIIWANSREVPVVFHLGPERITEWRVALEPWINTE